MSASRRDFSLRLLGAGLASAGLAPAAEAQGQPVEGVNYLRLAQPVPAGAGGKIEVIEFFWYECPHCNAFEPALDAWSKRLRSDVAFRRVPVWFREEPFGPQQRLFYTLESMGLLETLHRRVFAAIHDDHALLRNPEQIAAFALKNGIDARKFMATYASFAVQGKAQQARQTAAAYGVDAVPAMGVQGRFATNGELASAGRPRSSESDVNAQMLVVVDALVAASRSGAKT